VFRGDFAKLRRARQNTERVKAEAFNRIKGGLGQALLGLARSGWRAGHDPEGNAWVGRGGRRLTLFETGATFRTLTLEQTKEGIGLSVTGKRVGRRLVASIHEYGGTIRPKRRAGGKRRLMRFQTSGGWRIAAEVRIPRTSFLPLGRALPKPWERELIRIALSQGDAVGIGKGRIS